MAATSGRERKATPARGPSAALGRDASRAPTPAGSHFFLGRSDVARRRIAALVIVLAGALAYANSFGGVFVFDDIPQIVDNPSLAPVWPGLRAFLTRQRTLTVLSLSLNRSLGGLEPGGFHAVNLAIHLLAGLVLYAIVRRTLLLERFGERHRDSAAPLALVSALLWVVHPLQTESVTYVIQRAESLMGLFYLLTIYCALRAATDTRERKWQGLAVLSCVLGMASKPVMFTAPLLVLAYDRMFLAPSWRALLRKRSTMHLGLCCTWLVVIGTGLVGTVVDKDSTGETVGLGLQGVTPARYLLTQAEVILHYLRLSVWPNPLVLDYGWPVAGSISDVLVPVIVVALLLGVSLVAALRGRALGFLGLAFFVVLAPTSSVIPIRDPAFEHRMYLPLAAVAVALVLLVHALLRRSSSTNPATARVLGPILAVAACIALGARTFARNREYGDDVELWRATMRDAPRNLRASLAYRSAVGVRSINLLAMALARHERNDEALDVLRTGLAELESGPDSPEIRAERATLHSHWGNLLLALGRNEEAIEHYRKSLELDPHFAEIHSNWGVALRHLGRYREALEQLRTANRLAPESPEARNNLAWLLATCPDGDLRDGAEAVALAEKAVHSRHERDPSFLDTLASAYAEAGDFEAAVRWQEQAARAAPDQAKQSYLEHLALYREQEPLRDDASTPFAPR